MKITKTQLQQIIKEAIEEEMGGDGSRKVRVEWDTDGPNTPNTCLLYTSPSPRDGLLTRMPSSA